MATNTQSLSFLSLPLEIRCNIYKELLAPTPENSHLLWHDRPQQKKDPTFYPAILRASKRITFEASTILYCSNIFKIWAATGQMRQCTGGNYPDRLGWARDLLRTSQQELEEEACIKAREEPKAEGKEVVKPPRNPFRKPPGVGLIYPHCLHRMQNIEIVTSVDAVWSEGFGPRILSDIATLMLEIFKVLAANDISPTNDENEKTVRFTVRKFAFKDGDPSRIFPERLREKDAIVMRELISTIHETAAKRKVVLFEQIIGNEMDDDGDWKIETNEVALENIKQL